MTTLTIHPFVLPWSPSEINHLQLAFLHKCSIKTMARDLGRSPTAVNKALSRFGIRTYIGRSCRKKDSAPYAQRKRPKVLTSSPNIDGPQWVKIETLLTWISEEIGEVFVRLSSPTTETPPRQNAISPNTIYFVGKRAFNLYQLVQLANEIRCSKKLPIFYVEGVTVI